MKGQSDIPLILLAGLGLLSGQKTKKHQYTSAKSVHSYVWRYRAVHQFLQALMGGVPILGFKGVCIHYCYVDFALKHRLLVHIRASKEYPHSMF